MESINLVSTPDRNRNVSISSPRATLPITMLRQHPASPAQPVMSASTPDLYTEVHSLLLTYYDDGDVSKWMQGLRRLVTSQLSISALFKKLNGKILPLREEAIPVIWKKVRIVDIHPDIVQLVQMLHEKICADPYEKVRVNYALICALNLLGIRLRPAELAAIMKIHEVRAYNKLCNQMKPVNAIVAKHKRTMLEDHLREVNRKDLNALLKALVEFAQQKTIKFEWFEYMRVVNDILDPILYEARAKYVELIGHTTLATEHQQWNSKHGQPGLHENNDSYIKRLAFMPGRPALTGPQLCLVAWQHGRKCHRQMTEFHLKRRQRKDDALLKEIMNICQDEVNNQVPLHRSQLIKLWNLKGMVGQTAEHLVNSLHLLGIAFDKDQLMLWRAEHSRPLAGEMLQPEPGELIELGDLSADLAFPEPAELIHAVDLWFNDQHEIADLARPLAGPEQALTPGLYISWE